MFVGIDHGTTSMRLALADGKRFRILRQEAAALDEAELLDNILEGLGIAIDEIKLIAITYSMGDAIDRITPIDQVPDRGIKSRYGAGFHIGGGTHVYDTIKHSNIPAVVIPGLHRGNTPDGRFNVFSHGASPEKIGIVYNAYKMGYEHLVVSDISSNTVTLAAAEARLIGAIDACIFAPGVLHGPLDLEAIRDVDTGKYSANEAFNHAGVVKLTAHRNLRDILNAFESGDKAAVLAFDTLALFASMEIASMRLLVQDYGASGPEIFISGSVGDIPYVKQRIEHHIGQQVKTLGVWGAAAGCAQIAEDVYYGARDILGIGVGEDISQDCNRFKS